AAPPATPPAGGGIIVLRADTAMATEGYRLTVASGSGVTIVGGSAPGVFYGAQSFQALLPIEVSARPRPSLELPAVLVEDRPGLAHRGMHLDVARNFQPLEAVKKLLDVMAFYKLNRFHLHLSDDEGWRLAIGALPELTEVGGRRGHTPDEHDHLRPAYGSGPYPGRPPGSGHYSRAEYVDLLRYAAERHIQVVPEIDLPGHARAAIVAMEARSRRLGGPGREEDAARFRLRDPDDRSAYQSVQRYADNVINVCLESSYRFIEAVVDELAAMHADAGAPLTLVHVGGDEVPPGVWERSPACRRLLDESPDLNQTADLFDYFLRRSADILERRGLKLAGWEEVALAHRFHTPGPKGPNPEFVGRGFVPFVWNAVWGWGAEDLGYRLANGGYEVVLSNAGSLYFDLAYDKDPAEPGLYWAGFVDTRTAWEFLPFDLFRTARRDVWGNPIEETRYAAAVRPTAQGRRNIRGMQGQLWSETLVGPERWEYMAFPRLLALAERAWAPEPAWSRLQDRAARERALLEAWNEFANRLGRRELPRLDHWQGGIGYRLPPPGAVVEGGVLRANVEYPGLAIHYTTDGRVPTPQSPRYTGPVRVRGPVTLRVFDTRGRGGRAVVVGAAP
ncbi:MAG TPA: family 20 glycosylhydrolase, partial [Gemmatimonadales bacterium]|nr:family 20 glycosylhydrolase [Gemmatimonadales bacterium]